MNSRIMPENSDINTPEDERRKYSQRQLADSLYLSKVNNTLIDILSTRFHSQDFTQTRYGFMIVRLRLMCLFFAVTVPLFAFVDFLTLPSEQAQFLLVARILLSVSLLFLTYITWRHYSIPVARIVLAAAFLLPTIFYISSILSFTIIPETGIPLVFSMMPYLIVVMAGLFPLTIVGGLLLTATILLPLALFEIDQFNGNYLQLFDKFWLLSLFAGISLWMQSGQLSMLMELYRESTVDPLTGLINRRVLLRQAHLEQQHSTNDSIPFSVMMFDLDRFKRVNDIYGHLIGDRVLVMIARVMRRELRSTDIMARFGGEEFMAILPGLALEDSLHVAQRIVHAIRSEAVATVDGEFIYVTSSIGVTEYQPPELIEKTLKRVDELLYRAKSSGRDMVISDNDINSQPKQSTEEK